VLPVNSAFLSPKALLDIFLNPDTNRRFESFDITRNELFKAKGEIPTGYLVQAVDGNNATFSPVRYREGTSLRIEPSQTDPKTFTLKGMQQMAAGESAPRTQEYAFQKTIRPEERNLAISLILNNQNNLQMGDNPAAPHAQMG
jgi:hypothetical protein